jgi:predicted lipid-binding transport protein (Tim44 family)
MTPAAGRRGSRSDSQPTRVNSATGVCEPPPIAIAPLASAPRPHHGRRWVETGAGFAAGFLLGHLVLTGLLHEAIRAGLGAVLLLAVGTAAAMWCPDTDLDRGVRDIRRTDRGFDATRFAGYAAMMFRDVQSAGMARDARALRDRVTPTMYVELEARGDRLRASGRSACVAAVEVTSEVTEAWQDGNRDYVTAYVAGSMQSHTVDDATGQVVDGSPTLPVVVAAFLTFLRPAGLNFWTLSLIQEE